MKRLTERMADGTAQPNCSRCKHYKACGDEYYCDDNESCYEKIFEQLCIYEEKIKNGEILIMPCKEGTVLYEIRKCCESTGQKTRWKRGINH